MKTLYTFGLLLSAITCFSQDSVVTSDDFYPRWQFTTGIGFTEPSGLPAGVHKQISVAVLPLVIFNLPLASKTHYLSIGVGYESNRHIIDGRFVKTGNDHSFITTPPHYKQNEIQMNYLHFPILYRNAQLSGISMAVGPYLGYLVKAESNYKVDNTFYRDDPVIQNKFRVGLVLEADFVLRTAGSARPIFGYGIHYQLTNNLENSKSFKPLTGYLKIGFAL